MDFYELTFTIRVGIQTFDQKVPYPNRPYELFSQNKQCKAREKHENGNIFNYKQFPRSTVKYFTDALFGVLPECDNIVETMQLMHFILYDGQADAGRYL